MSGSGGGCASSQPAATAAGLKILAAAGNATDAAVAMAAALAVTEPCSTGIGGDCFALFFDAASSNVESMLGNGRSPAALSLEVLQQAGFSHGGLPLDPFSPLCATVPGAALAWEQAVQKHGSGKLSFAQVLAPAIALAAEGFVVQPITAHSWAQATAQLLQTANGCEMLLEDPAAPGVFGHSCSVVCVVLCCSVVCVVAQLQCRVCSGTAAVSCV